VSEHVLLINPNSPFLFDPCALPPLGLLYLGAALEANGFEPRIVDLAFKESTIKGFDPFLIGIGSVTANYPGLPDLISQCRDVYPGVPIIIGGPHFSIVPADSKRLGADSVGIGDCENAIIEAATDALSGEPIFSLYRSYGGVVDVNKYPIPARHLLPIHDYTYKIRKAPVTSLITSRGCPYTCAFCSHWEGYREVRFRHTENVIEEVGILKSMGFRTLLFFDDEFNLNHLRMMKLCKALQSEKITFRAMARTNLFNEEQAQALVAAGCTHLSFGVESGNADILRSMGKQTTPEINSRARSICRDNGILFRAFVVIGLPGETRETALETKRWLIDNQVDEITCTAFVPNLGSPIVKNPEQYDTQFRMAYQDHVMSYWSNEQIQRDDLVRTSSLSATEIAELRDEVDEDAHRGCGIEPPLRVKESTRWKNKR